MVAIAEWHVFGFTKSNCCASSIRSQDSRRILLAYPLYDHSILGGLSPDCHEDGVDVLHLASGLARQAAKSAD